MESIWSLTSEGFFRSKKLRLERPPGTHCTQQLDRRCSRQMPVRPLNRTAGQLLSLASVSSFLILQRKSCRLQSNFRWISSMRAAAEQSPRTGKFPCRILISQHLISRFILMVQGPQYYLLRHALLRVLRLQPGRSTLLVFFLKNVGY